MHTIRLANQYKKYDNVYEIIVHVSQSYPVFKKCKSYEPAWTKQLCVRESYNMWNTLNSYMTIYYNKNCQIMEMFKLKIKLHHVHIDFHGKWIEFERYKVIQSMWVFLLGMDGKHRKTALQEDNSLPNSLKLKKGKSGMIAFM